MVQIRRMSREDVVAVVPIEAECFSVPWSENAFYDALNQKDAYYYVAIAQEEIVGYCGAYGIIDEGDVNQVAVRSNFRKQGIARQLVTTMIQEMEKDGFVSMTLEVRAGNTPAIALYQSLGFVSEGLRKNFYEKPTEDALIMWKR